MNEALIEKSKKLAFAYLENSYAPYSKFHVSAVVFGNDVFYPGVNVENASFGLTNCAERSAMFNAYTHGERKDDLLGIVIVSNANKLTYPCGACRQVMIELLNKNCDVIITNKKEEKRLKVEDLLPDAFSEEDL